MGGADIGAMRNVCEEVMVMGRHRKLNTNVICRQCIRKCKQPIFMDLVQCPKFISSQSQTPLPSRREKSSRIQNKAEKSGK